MTSQIGYSKILFTRRLLYMVSRSECMSNFRRYSCRNQNGPPARPLLTFSTLPKWTVYKEMQNQTRSVHKSSIISLSPTQQDSKPASFSSDRNLEQLAFQLQMDIRRLKRAHQADVKAVIDLLEKGARLEEQNAFFLSCCGTLLPDMKLENRNQLVDRLWDLISKSGTTNVESFEALLKVHTENSHSSIDPLLILQKMKSLDLKLPDDVYYYSLLLFCQRGDTKGCTKVLTLMKEDDIVVSEKILNALILGNARAGDLKAAEGILDLMKSSHVDPSAETYTVLMQCIIESSSLTEADKLEDLKSIFEVTKDKHTFYDESTFRLLKVAAMSNNPSLMDYVLEWIPSVRVNYLNLVNTVKEIIYCGQTLAGIKVIKHFSSTLKMQGEQVAGFYIRDAILVNEDPSIILEVCSYLVDQNINEFAFNIATDCAFRNKKFDLAVTLLDEMNRRRIELRPHYFLPLIVHYFETAGAEGLLRVVEKMNSLNVPMDWSTSYGWVIPRLLEAVPDPVEVTRILKVSSDTSYSSGTLSAILAYLLKQRRISDASTLIKKVKGAVKKPELLVQNLTKAILEFEQRDNLKENLMLSIGILKYLKEYIPSDDKNDYVGLFLVRVSGAIGHAVPELWNDFLQGLAKANVTISDGTQLLLQSTSSGLVTLKIDPDLNERENKAAFPNHRDMDTRTLECLVEELTSKSMNTRGALRKLFLKYCQSNDLERALEVKDKFEMDSATLSDGMKAALFGLYVRNGLLEPATAIYRSLRESRNKSGEKESVDIDFYKIVDLATLMLQNNLIEDAVSLMKNDGLDCPPPLNPKSVGRNVVRFLEALSEAELNQINQNSVLKQILELLLEKSMAEPTNPVIGVLIRSYIKRGEIETAVEEFGYYSQKYKITPCLQELTYVVLDKPNLLEKVFSSCAAARGEIGAKHTLAFAKSDMGDMDGAAKILLTLGKDIQFIKILKQCEFLGQRRETQKILNLAKSLNMTERNYDCSKLFNVALQACKRYDDAEGFRRIIAIMQEQDVFIEPHFLKYQKPIAL